MSGSKSGRSISIYADACTAEQAEAVAAAENRKIGQLGGEALALWASLPAAARAALRYVKGLGTESDLEYAHRELTRALLIVQRAVASERASEEIRAQFGGLEEMSDEEIEGLATELSEGPPEKDMRERLHSFGTSSGTPSGGDKSRSGTS